MFRTAYGTGLWYIVILLDIVSKAGVPIFFMISGALLLGKDESIKELFFKRVLRYAIIILLFSFVYYIRLYIQHPEYGFSIKYFITYIYSTPFVIPFWFLYSYLSFLIVLPVLRAIVRTLKEQEYFLLFGFSATLWILPILEDTFKLNPVAISNGFGTSFIIYPIIGYGIANVLTDKYYEARYRIIIASTLFVGWATSVIMNTAEHVKTGGISGNNIDRFSWITAVAIFYFIIYICEKRKLRIPDSVERVIGYIGGSTLCIFLFEDMLRSDLFLNIFKFVSDNVSSLFMCIPYTICIVISGVIISKALRAISLINRLNI